MNSKLTPMNKREAMNQKRRVAEIGLLMYPGSQAALHGLTDLFAVANRIADEHESSQLPILRVSHWCDDGESAQPAQLFDSHPTSDSRMVAVIIPPSLFQLTCEKALNRLAMWIREKHAEGAAVGSVCLGVFLLAQSGLLDQRIATIHRTYAKALEARFPAIRVDADKPIIDDGDIITAAGLMAWADLGLRLVDRLMGPSIAASTAQFLEIKHCDSTQACGSHFSPILTHGDSAVLKVQHWLQRKGAVDVSLSMMAALAGLEARTFLRRFRAATGLRPIQYCQHVRVGKAREMLEFTNGTVDHIAWMVGYLDPGTFRTAFKKVTGITPADYRKRFGAKT